jgi:hypothetical protein
MASDGASAPHAHILGYPPGQQLAVSLQPQDESQRTAQREIVAALHRALDARRERIIISESGVGPVKWAVILLQGLCTLIAIAMVHSDNKLTCAIAVAMFATGIALFIGAARGI